LEKAFPHFAKAKMTTTFLMRSAGSPRREAAGKALRDAGVGVVEVEDWAQAAGELRRCAAAVVIGDEDLDALDTRRLTKGVTELAGTPQAPALAPDAARALSHELRTPLSAMAGWVHLIETGKLDEAGLKKAVSRLRGNIDDQVKTIERFLGANQQEGRG
jgi:signal transduction histidine kinase